MITVQIKKSKLVMSVLLIVLMGWTVYFNSLNGEFLWDDDMLVKDNIYIKDWAHFPKLFTTELGARFGIDIGTKFNFFRPIQMATYMLDYSIWGSVVRGYHITNVTLHISASLALFWLIQLLFNRWGISLLTGLFFVVHPIHTEAVSYISGRADPLTALYLFLAFIFYIKAIRSNRNRFTVLTCFSFALALLARENAIIFPILLWLYHGCLNVKVKTNPFISVLSIAFAYVVVRITFLKSLLSTYHATTILDRIPGVFVAISNYIRLLIAPYHLHMEYGIKLYELLSLDAITGLTLTLCLAFVAFKIRNIESQRIFLFSIAWFFVALAPNANIYPLNAYMAEHWLYIPSVGYFLILAVGVTELLKRDQYKYIGFGIIIALTAFYSISTIKQNKYWQNRVSLYTMLIEHSPDSARVHFNLGNAHDDAGDYDKARQLYRRAIELNSKYADPYVNLGHMLYKEGKWREAIALYQKSIEINPKHAAAYVNLGVAYFEGDMHKKAIESYKKAIELNPHDPMAYNNWGTVLYDLGNVEDAIELYNKSISIDPRFGRAYNNLSITYFNKHDYKRAIKYFDQAQSLGYIPMNEFKEALNPYR